MCTLRSQLTRVKDRFSLFVLAEVPPLPGTMHEHPALLLLSLEELPKKKQRSRNEKKKRKRSEEKKKKRKRK